MSGTRLLSRKAPATRGSGRSAFSPAGKSLDSPALVVVAHGERGGVGDDRLVHDITEKLRYSGHYRDVRSAFISKEPSLKSAFTELSPGPVTVYPLFMSDGYFVRRAIPKSLADIDTEIHQVDIAAPFGLSECLPHVVTDLAISTAHRHGRAARECRLLLVAHGSKHDRASRNATLDLAVKLAKTNSFAGVEDCYLEETPFVNDRVADIKGPAIVVGLFIGLGMHGAIDLPVAVGNSGRTDIMLSSPLGQSPNLIDNIYGDLLKPNPAKAFA